MKIDNKVESHSKEYCVFCGDNNTFRFPKDLFESFVNNDVVIFAGAGISTEAKNIYPSTMFQEIKNELKIKENLTLTFSELMSEYCKRKKGRRELIEKIIERIEYVRSFPDLYSTTVHFHQTLAKIPCIREIVTTNWDDFFETECHATPFQYEQDMAFWETTKRKVLKLHGSINNLGSIVATSEEYKNRYDYLNTSLIGSKLKLMIANKRLVFIGYSFGDEDFNRIYSFLHTQLGSLIKKPYIITLDKSKDKKWKELGLLPIYTAGAYFLETLIRKLEIRKCIISSDIIDTINNELLKVEIEHIKLTQEGEVLKYPEIVYCLSFQDGIIHAFEHFLHHINYGESLCVKRLTNVLRGYEQKIEEKKADKKWYDVAYLEGYLYGNIYALMNKEENKDFPYYLDFVKEREFRTYEQFMKSIKNRKNRKESITEYATKIAKQAPNNDITFQHTAFL